MSERPLPDDLYTEPRDFSVDTLACLGPLRALAGVWSGTRGLDVKPKADGPRKQAFVERLELQPIDPVTNGPQLLYGLRYHTHITKPGQVKTYHEQVGYWLWEPATGAVIHTLTIPRGEVAMAGGTAAADARSFALQATQGLDTFGICSAPFLDQAFKTTAFHIRVTVHDDDSWTYEEDTVLQIRGQAEPFHHTDRNTLHRLAEPTPNPLARPA
ncbi:FABP family protein [Ideonella livida]|uniref:FABP family protein n=1 Tax=Ideonella livida TaxID=2707176 RepID=A0A7C9PKK7_9BURK|nr:heme-binding beta-barrel domain-containing protein [Ideonella livida]NDY93394.1 FABP family protein [Ideonella livida]